MRRLPVLTQSSITTFRRCPREYYYNYVMLRKSLLKSKALTFGSMWHAGLNAWWFQNDHRHTVAVGAMLVYAEENGVDAFEQVKAECLMAGYTARWDDGMYKTEYVEKGFRTDLVIPGSRAPSFHLEGSVDAIVWKRNGTSENFSTLYNVESKTTSFDISAGSDYWRHVYALDSQVSTYNAASRAMGYDIRGTIYDVTRKPELVPLKATPEESKKYTKPTAKEPVPRLYANQREHDETPEEYRKRLTEDIIARPDWYFARQTIVRLEHDDEEHERDVTQTAQMIQFCTEHTAFPRSPNACTRFNRLCDYFAVCAGETTIEDGTRFETKTSQHEELCA